MAIQGMVEFFFFLLGIIEGCPKTQHNTLLLGSLSRTKAWLLKQFAFPRVTFIVFSVLKD